MFGSTFRNGRALTTLKLRDNNDLIVEDKLVLGADYIFVLDSLYSVPVGTTIPITLNNRPVETDSKLMGHDFKDTHGILTTPALWAIILHGANLIDCTIVHARITTNPTDMNRQDNEKRYAQSLGMRELEFPYKSEKRVMQMMRDDKKYFEQNRIANKITRKNLDIVWDDEIFDPYNMEKNEDPITCVISHIKNHDTNVNDTINDEENELDDINEDEELDGDSEESFEDFLKQMNDTVDTTNLVPTLTKISEAYMNSLSKLMKDHDFSKSEIVEIEKWSDEFSERLEKEFVPIMEKISKSAEHLDTDNSDNSIILADDDVVIVDNAKN